MQTQKYQQAANVLLATKIKQESTFGAISNFL
jgi:hypothetical protein